MVSCLVEKGPALAGWFGERIRLWGLERELDSLLVVLLSSSELCELSLELEELLDRLGRAGRLVLLELAHDRALLSDQLVELRGGRHGAQGGVARDEARLRGDEACDGGPQHPLIEFERSGLGWAAVVGAAELSWAGPPDAAARRAACFGPTQKPTPLLTNTLSCHSTSTVARLSNPPLQPLILCSTVSHDDHSRRRRRAGR